jgi:AhpD family alkylhydroperoxidase
MASTFPADRIQLDELAPKPMAAVFRLEQSIDFDSRIAALVKVRASQINGCAFCIDMHWKDARVEGEEEERLYMLDAWRESRLYDEREQAALALCEAITLISEQHIPDEVWERAQASFSGDELAELVFTIAAINTWNRLMITAEVEPGLYEPGAFAATA